MSYFFLHVFVCATFMHWLERVGFFLFAKLFVNMFSPTLTSR